MRVLVTGGAGFIGSHVVDDLVGRGVEVTVLDNLDPQAHAVRPDYLNEGATYVWGDCRYAEAWNDALVGVTAVCHQAGKVGLGVDFGDVDDYVSHNDSGWAVGLRALHDRRFGGRIVLASSMVVYGEGRYRCPEHALVSPAPRRQTDLEAGRFEPPCPHCGRGLVSEEVPEDAVLDPRNVYAATKLHQEHLLLPFTREHPVSSVALRYHNVYGPRMPRNTPYAGVASIFRSALEDGRAPRVTEDGCQRRNFVHVRDVASANVAALLGEREGGTYVACNIASSQSRTVGEMADELARSFGAAPTNELWPKVTGGFRLGDVRHVFASTKKAQTELGFVSSISFADGMAEFARAKLRTSVAR